MLHKTLLLPFCSWKMTQVRKIGLKIDQALLQDATGTLGYSWIWRTMGLDRAKTDCRCGSICDHILQIPIFKNGATGPFVLVLAALSHGYVIS